MSGKIQFFTDGDGEQAQTWCHTSCHDDVVRRGIYALLLVVGVWWRKYKSSSPAGRLVWQKLFSMLEWYPPYWGEWEIEGG